MPKPIFIQRKNTIEYEFSTNEGTYMVRWKEREDLEDGKLVNVVTVHRWEKSGNDHYWKLLADPVMIITKKPSIPRSKKLLIHFI